MTIIGTWLWIITCFFGADYQTRSYRSSQSQLHVTAMIWWETTLHAIQGYVQISPSQRTPSCAILLCTNWAEDHMVRFCCQSDQFAFGAGVDIRLVHLVHVHLIFRCFLGIEGRMIRNNTLPLFDGFFEVIFFPLGHVHETPISKDEPFCHARTVVHRCTVVYTGSCKVDTK